jgi:Zn-dependent oligopeptidase
MTDIQKTIDHLRYTTQKLEEAQTHLSGAERNSPDESIDEIFGATEETLADLAEVIRDLKVHAELWQEAERLDEEGTINITEGGE